MKISPTLLLLSSTTADELRSHTTQWDKFRALIHNVFGIGQTTEPTAVLVQEECTDRCLIHPTNRYTCGKARSSDACAAVGCCWDENAQHCYKEAWTYCPQDRCEQIHPVDRAVCAPIMSRIANNEEITQFECESAGCCYDTFQEQCYSSSPSVKSPYPDTGECAQVEPSDRESCGFGLSRDSCAAMTGCCWDVSDESNNYCYKSAFQTLKINGTQIDLKARNSGFSSDQINAQSGILEELPNFNLKMASPRTTPEPTGKSMATKIQLWINFIAQLTQKIETACESKVEPTVCIDEASENVLIPACDELLFKTYELRHVDNQADAYELLEAINDVLTWFCLDQPEARFCRTVVLSGFTLSDTQVEGDEIAEANNRFDALVALGKNGMLGTYEHSEKSAMDITTCSNTYLLIQTYQPARDDINQLPEVDLSETCAQMGACWKSMSFRDVIFNLYGEYDNETRSTFLGLWQAVGPLLTPGTEPMLANSVCIQPMANSIQKTRALFDDRFSPNKPFNIEKSANE